MLMQRKKVSRVILCIRFLEIGNSNALIRDEKCMHVHAQVKYNRK